MTPLDARRRAVAEAKAAARDAVTTALLAIADAMASGELSRQTGRALTAAVYDIIAAAPPLVIALEDLERERAAQRVERLFGRVTWSFADEQIANNLN